MPVHANFIRAAITTVWLSDMEMEKKKEKEKDE